MLNLSIKKNSPRNAFIGAIALTLFVEKVSAQTQPPLSSSVMENAFGTTGSSVSAGIAQWTDVAATNSITAQMKAGADVVIRSELFDAIAYASLVIATITLLFILVPWAMKCSEARVIVHFDPVEILVPVLLILLLMNPIGEGFAMQTIAVGTRDLFNSMQNYIITNGGAATQYGGSAVRQATAKAQIEQSIRNTQVVCAATLNQDERKTCYNDGYESVQAALDEFRDAQWAKNLSVYSSQVLLQEGKNADQGTNVIGAIGGVVGGAVKTAADNAVNYGSGAIAAPTYAMLLLVSTAFGVVIGVLQLLMTLFFPLSVALSLAPIFRGSWVKWFTGMFGVFVSGLFLRMMIIITAITTVSGSSISGGLFVVASTMISAVCGLMAIFSVISTVTGIAGNVSNNVIALR